jgi:type IV pilus assembly protein PilQ
MAVFMFNLNSACYAQNKQESPPQTEGVQVTTAAENSQSATQQETPAEVTPTAQQGASGEEQETQVDQTGVSVTESQTKPGCVSLVFKDADIRTVLDTLSYKSGINIVAANDVEGKVNIRLVDVPWETALQIILKNHALTYEKEGNIIRVVTLKSITEEELQSEVFILNYSKAKDVAAAVKETLTERGKVTYDDRTNTIIITDIPTNLYKIKEVIKRLDKRTPQVWIEAKFIETTLDKDDNLGIDWTLKATVSASKRPTTLPFDREESPFSRSKGEGGIKEGFGNYLPRGNSLTDFPSTTLPMFPYATKDSFAFGTLDFSTFKAILEILNKRTDTKIISNPTVTTLDNKEAKVNVSSVFNIPTYERNTSTGAMEITGYTEKPLGVVLTVIPHVNESGDIVVDLKPEVNAFLQWDEFGTGTNTIKAPRFSTRTAETQVMIKSGQTIAIGGLMKETSTKMVNKVPLLGDIPLLGELFKKTEDGVDTTDLLIFVTVRLIAEDEDDKGLMQRTEKKALHSKGEVKF